MPTGQKSSLHPSALTINGITPGRTIVKFNVKLGIFATYVVMSRPAVLTTVVPPRGGGYLFTKTPGPNARTVNENALTVKLRCVKTGRVTHHYLSDMGVVRDRYGEFNPTNFTVDYRKRHLLSALVPDPAS